jgi:hypothetical protein
LYFLYSSDDDDKLDKPITEAMDELCGEAPLEKPVVNGINTRFALCSSMSGSILSTYFLLLCQLLFVDSIAA